MTILELVKEGLRYARRCRSLWLFGFIAGLASGGSSGGGAGGRGGGGGNVSVGAGPVSFSGAEIAPFVALIVVLVLIVLVLRYVSEGALIEGIVRARKGEPMTTGDGFRAGWKHWGVLLRVALLYVAIVAGSLVVLAAPVVLAGLALGPVGVVALGIPAAIVAVPWLITTYLIQAFASRIAVLENRHAIDALRKARIFLHGRLMHGLKLVVASVIGTVAIVVAGLLTIVPVVLLLVVALRMSQHIVPLLVLGCLALLPVFYVLMAMLGTFRSSIWTIGYLEQAES